MYKYEDFKDNIEHEYLIDTVLLAKSKFAGRHGSNIVKRSDLIGCGDSWMNLACIDKLHELGYIAVVRYAEISNDTIYRNVRL